MENRIDRKTRWAVGMIVMLAVAVCGAAASTLPSYAAPESATTAEP